LAQKKGKEKKAGKKRKKGIETVGREENNSPATDDTLHVGIYAAILALSPNASVAANKMNICV